MPDRPTRRPDAAGSLMSIHALQAITETLNDLPRLMEAVRTVYRAQTRPPIDEPATVRWVETYVRYYLTKPLGLLDAAHVRAFLTHLADEPGMTRREQEEARAALEFLHREVLQQKIETVTGYVKAPETRPPSPYVSAKATTTLWEG